MHKLVSAFEVLEIISYPKIEANFSWHLFLFLYFLQMKVFELFS